MMPGADRVEFSSEEWASLMDLASVDATHADEADLSDLLAASDELTRLSRRISGQYVDVLAHFASQAFAGTVRPESSEQALAALNALTRLASAAEDHEQLALLGELEALLPGAAERRRNSRSRHRALAALRDWLPRFAGTMSEEDGARLVQLVKWEGGNAPLMDELSNIHGIGPKRLGRLYAAGLNTVKVVATADPTEVASVTGLPGRLSEVVVDATRQFAIDERRRILESLRDRARRLREILLSVPEADDDVKQLADEAAHEVELTLHRLSHTEIP